MSSFTIAHDIPGRMRIRYGKNKFSSVQGEVLKKDLYAWPMIESVEVNNVTGSVLMLYDKAQKGLLLNKLKDLDIQYLQNADTSSIVVHSQSPEAIAMNREYMNRFFKIIGKRYFIKWFLPMGLGNAITIYKSIQFIREGLNSLLQCKINVPLLDATSIGVSLIQKNYTIAGNIMMLLNISDLLEDYTRKKTKLELSNSLSIQFDKVWILEDGVEQEIVMSKLQKGDVVISQMGSMIPIDGEVVDGEAMINESSFTGEPLSRHVKKNDTVFAGTLVEEGKLFIRVRNLQDESRISNIVKMIDTNESLKASIQAKAEHLADSIVPFSFLGFFGVLALTRNVTRATSVLMVDYSCAIKLSTPISVISAIREAADCDITIKGGKYLEAFAEADTIVFDKTGTLTNAEPVLEKVIPFGAYTESEVLKTAACLEEHFPHSVARAIVKGAAEQNLHHEEEHAEVQYIVAHGIATTLHGERAIIGSKHFVAEDEGIVITPEQQAEIDAKSGACSVVYLAIGSELAGVLCIADPPRAEAKQAITMLRDAGISNLVMLTGDSEQAASRTAEMLGITQYHAQVLPEDKHRYVEELKAEGKRVIMVGDGINDAPALAAANVSVAMSDASDIAREAADITLRGANLTELATLRKLSERLMKRIHSNYRFILGFNSTLLLLGLLSVLPPATSAFLHNASTMAICAKSMTPVLKKPSDNKENETEEETA